MWNVFRAELTKLKRPSLSISTIAAVTFVTGLVTSLLFLLVDSPEGNGERGVRIGRDINNEICLDDITVSRSHALISKSDGYTIKDLGSLNGTYLNAVVVREAKINAGDEVQIGKYHLTLFIGGNK